VSPCTLNVLSLQFHVIEPSDVNHNFPIHREDSVSIIKVSNWLMLFIGAYYGRNYKVKTALYFKT
jgi:hypothetical protein